MANKTIEFEQYKLDREEKGAPGFCHFKNVTDDIAEDPLESNWIPDPSCKDFTQEFMLCAKDHAKAQPAKWWLGWGSFIPGVSPDDGEDVKCSLANRSLWTCWDCGEGQWGFEKPCPTGVWEQFNFESSKPQIRSRVTVRGGKVRRRVCWTLTCDADISVCRFCKIHHDF